MMFPSALGARRVLWSTCWCPAYPAWAPATLRWALDRSTWRRCRGGSGGEGPMEVMNFLGTCRKNMGKSYEWRFCSIKWSIKWSTNKDMGKWSMKWRVWWEHPKKLEVLMDGNTKRIFPLPVELTQGSYEHPIIQLLVLDQMDQQARSSTESSRST